MYVYLVLVRLGTNSFIQYQRNKLPIVTLLNTFLIYTEILYFCMKEFYFFIQNSFTIYEF